MAKKEKKMYYTYEPASGKVRAIRTSAFLDDSVWGPTVEAALELRLNFLNDRIKADYAEAADVCTALINFRKNS